MFDKISGSPQYMAPEAGLLELEPGIVLGIGYKLYTFFLMFKLSIYVEMSTLWHAGLKGELVDGRA